MSLTLSILESDCQLLRFGLLVSKVSLYRPHPCSVTTCTGQQLHLLGYCREIEKEREKELYKQLSYLKESQGDSFRCSSSFLDADRGKKYETIDVALRPRWVALTEVVSTDLVCLVSSHEQPHVPIVLVLHQFYVSCTSLLPLWGVSHGIKAKELCSSVRKTTNNMCITANDS